MDEVPWETLEEKGKAPAYVRTFRCSMHSVHSRLPMFGLEVVRRTYTAIWCIHEVGLVHTKFVAHSPSNSYVFFFFSIMGWRVSLLFH